MPCASRAASKIQREITPGQKVEAFAYNGTVPGPQIRVTEGDRVRINLENELDQPRRLHAEWQGIPWKCDTLNVAPGERWDV
jgi:FtsP/CotA-like multicopper oxidase with cupredoxin domain